MPDYITQAEVTAKIPGKTLRQALDDDQDGVADSDVWSAVRVAAQTEVDTRLSANYATPFSGNIPPVVKHATLIFVCESLFKRRGKEGKNNPFSKEAEELRKKLDDIGSGKEKLLFSSKRAVPSGAIVLEDAKTVSISGKTAS